MKSFIFKLCGNFFLKKYLDIKFNLNNFFLNYHIKKKKFKDYKAKNSNIFFGYHDKINLIGNKILFHENIKENFYVGYFNNNKKIKLKKTQLCSWQLGSQLQWIDKNNIIFNGYQKNYPRSIIYNIKKNSLVRTFGYLVFNLCNQKRKFVSLNFKKIFIYRKGYGYDLKNFVNNEDALKDDLKVIDIKSGKILNSISKIALGKLINNSENNYYFNHATFSPSGKFLAFFLVKNIGNERKINFIQFNLRNNNFKLIKKIKKISHYCWIDDDRILYTSLKSKNFCNYKIFNFKKNMEKNINFGINQDGHPMANPVNKNLILTDTYPNKFGYQKLLVFHLKKNKILWETDLKYSTNFLLDKRCDLHPKWSEDGKKIVVDYAIKSRRIIRVYDYLL